MLPKQISPKKNEIPSEYLNIHYRLRGASQPPAWSLSASSLEPLSHAVEACFQMPGHMISKHGVAEDDLLKILRLSLVGEPCLIVAVAARHDAGRRDGHKVRGEEDEKET